MAVLNPITGVLIKGGKFRHHGEERLCEGTCRDWSDE